MHGSTPEEPACPYCDGPMTSANKDHIIPRSMGVNFGPANLIRVCVRCNHMKGSMTPDAIRVLAQRVFDHAEFLDRLADRVDAIMEERGLTLSIVREKT